MTANWQDQAACKNRDRDLFFNDAPRSRRLAMAICATCPVRPECLEAALGQEMQYGIWGGLTAAARERVSRRGRRVAVCGTDAGYIRHIRARVTPPCEACKLAHAEATRERYRRHNEPRMGSFSDERDSKRASKRARIGRLLDAGWCVQCAAGGHGNCHGDCACDRPHRVAS